MERTELITPSPIRTKPTKTVGTWREDQEFTNLRPRMQKIKLHAGARKALRH
jgi:hypothetical protein